MTWLAILGAIFQFALAFVNFLRDRQTLEAGAAEAIAKNLSEANALIEKARAARDAADAGKLPDDDPYLRD